MIEAYTPKKYQIISRKLIRKAGRFLYQRFSRPEIEGAEKIPAEGPYLITINHLSVFDPPFVIPFWPIAPTPLGAIELWTQRGKALLTRMYGAIPIDRDRYDQLALEKVVLTLKSGTPILMAPEGRITRVPGLRRAKLGVAYILERARVPIVPVGIIGGTPDFLDRAIKGERPIIKMRVGLPYNLPYEKVTQLPKKEAYQALADYVMAKVAAVLPEEYRGYYFEYDKFIEKLDLSDMEVCNEENTR